MDYLRTRPAVLFNVSRHRAADGDNTGGVPHNRGRLCIRVPTRRPKWIPLRRMGKVHQPATGRLMRLAEENMAEIFRRDKHPIRLELTDLIGKCGGAPAQLPDTMDINTGIIDRLMIAGPSVHGWANDATHMARLSQLR